MRDKTIIGAITVLLCMLCLFCQAQSDTDSVKSVPAIVKQQADSMGYYFVKNDFKHYMKYQHPALIKRLGGEESLIKILNENVSKKGMKALSVVTEPPLKIIVADSNFQCTMQQTTLMEVQKNKLEIISTLIGISYDNGNTWFFINGSGNQSLLKEVLPEMSKDLVIDEQHTRVIK